ncbi:hypothetical protein LTR93_009783 [Exophiala xenobiotica]|nr:hypothetical protein LTR93_009783 [Exophiala xenobiotica]KAK5402814.1 hypothetical protein LTR06_010531 [Exophiala xenobiotica]
MAAAAATLQRATHMTTSTNTEAPESQAQEQKWSVPSTTPSSAFRDKGATATRRDQADELEHVTGLRSFYHPHTQLGECPLYRAEDKTLHFIDVLGQRIHILDLSSGDPKSYSMRTIECPERITFIAFSALRSPEGTSTQRYYVVCYFQGLATVDEADGSWTVLQKIIPDEEKHRVRLNDGAIDSRGRLWFGTIDMPGADRFREQPTSIVSSRASGSLFCYTIDGPLDVHESGGFFCSNGIGWSPDDQTMFFTDSATKTIWAYDFDAERAKISNKRIFIKRTDVGEPDGLLVDSLGNVYIFLWEGSKVEKYDPAGRYMTHWEVNAWRVTHGAWVGEHLDEMILTSAVAWDGLPKWHDEEAGALFWLKNLGVRGMAKHKFGRPAS